MSRLRDDAGQIGDAPRLTVQPESSFDTARGRGSSRGTAITLSTVIALLIATGLTILGFGAADTAVANFDASSWLWSANRSEVDRVNGISAKVDTRTKITDAQNHEVQISQTDKYLILRDLDTGQISALDLTTLQVSAVMPTTPGLGVSVALHGESAFVIDSIQGQVRQLDPRSLAPSGEVITLPNGITPGGFDGKGTLWIGVPTEGTVVAISPGTGTPGVNGLSPKVVRTVTVSPPGQDLVLTVLDEGVAVLNNTQQLLITVHGTKVTTTPVPIDRPGLLPSRTTGLAVPVTIPDDRKVIIMDGERVIKITVPGSGSISPAVIFAGHVYCPDAVAGVVYEFDSNGRPVRQIKIASAGGPLELEVREDHLFINAPDGSTARVVDSTHVVKDVNKYEDGILGGHPPPAPPPTQEPKPTIAVPGKPQNVSAVAGDGSVKVSWGKARANGAPITRYVVQGGGQTITVGANQRTIEVTGLSNGTSYKFTVYAVNAVGPGPKATSRAVTPTRNVPDPPTTVTAVEKPDGTVEVSWPAANGQGHKIIRYAVTAVTGGALTPMGEVVGTLMTIAPGSLTYGTQYAFTVASINDLNAASAESPLSNVVVPFTSPGPPQNLTAVTVPTQRGTIQVNWQPAADNGRPILKYVVDPGTGTTSDVTGTTINLSGFADDVSVQVSVHAVNVAGDGPTATTTARTIGQPTLTVTGTNSGYNSVSVTFTPNNHGGTATCRLAISGGVTAQVACNTAPVTLTVTGLWPNNTYSYTATATNAAGTATATGTRATTQLRATVLCGVPSYCGAGVWAYSVPSQQNSAYALGRVPVGSQFLPQCNIANDLVDARPWGGKLSNQWLRFTFQGSTAYFPFSWVNTDGGNNLALLPDC